MTTANLRHQSERRVLVADDDPALLDLVTGILDRAGYTVVAAHDGREASRILFTHCDFVAAVLDAEMPHLTGHDLIDHMRTEKRLMRIPVIIMSGGQGSLLTSRALMSGASVFLPKPFTSDQLRNMLKMLECSRRADRQLSAA